MYDKLFTIAKLLYGVRHLDSSSFAPTYFSHRHLALPDYSSRMSLALPCFDALIYLALHWLCFQILPCHK